MNAVNLSICFFLCLPWLSQISSSELNWNGKAISDHVKKAIAGFFESPNPLDADPKNAIAGFSIELSGYFSDDQIEQIRSFAPTIPINYLSYGVDSYEKIGIDKFLTIHASSQEDVRGSIVYGIMGHLSHTAITIDVGSQTNLFHEADFKYKIPGINSVCYSVYDNLLDPRSNSEIEYMVLYSDATNSRNNHELLKCIIAQTKIFNLLKY